MLLFMAEVRDKMMTRMRTLFADRPIGQLIALRLLIGLFEAGFYPTVLFYLSTFYTRFDLATRIGVFYGQYAIAGAFSGAIGMSEELIFLFCIVFSISEN